MVLTIGSRYKLPLEDAHLNIQREHRNRRRAISRDIMLQEAHIKAHRLKSDLAGRDQRVSKRSQLIMFTKAVLQLGGLMNRWLKCNAADPQSSKTR